MLFLRVVFFKDFFSFANDAVYGNADESRGDESCGDESRGDEDCGTSFEFWLVGRTTVEANDDDWESVESEDGESTGLLVVVLALAFLNLFRASQQSSLKVFRTARLSKSSL